MVFCCGRYRLAVADMVVADMVCGRYGRTPFNNCDRGGPVNILLFINAVRLHLCSFFVSEAFITSLVFSYLVLIS